MPELITLTMNPAIDIATTVRRVVPTLKLRCGPVQRSAGGGGINVARVLNRFGHDVVALYPVGGPTGARLKQMIDEQGVKSVIVPVGEETRESFTTVEEETGAEYRFVLSGPRFSDAECRAMLQALDDLDNARDVRFTVLSGSLPDGVAKDFYARAAAIARAGGAEVVVDSYGEALKLAIEAGGLTMVKPSQRELSDLMARPLTGRAEQLAACRSLVGSGKVAWVALTLGAEGAMLVGREVALFAPAVPVEVKSSVGAGDSFLGALVGRFAEGKPVEEAFRAAVAAGSAALLSPGTTLCHREDVERLTPLVRIERL
jgi:6-phosphofructokinase 2